MADPLDVGAGSVASQVLIFWRTWLVKLGVSQSPVQMLRRTFFLCRVGRQRLADTHPQARLLCTADR